MGRELGLFLEQRREALGLSRRDLAEQTELSYSYISQLETGDREPALKAMRLLAPALGVAVEELAALVAGDDWSSSMPDQGFVGRPAAMRTAASTSLPDMARTAPSKGTDPRGFDRARLSVERRLREVPPLERIALLNALIAQAVDELGEQR